MIKLKTIHQPMCFAKLFDAEVAELLNDGYYYRDGFPQVISHESKEDLLIAIMEKFEEENNNGK